MDFHKAFKDIHELNSNLDVIAGKLRAHNPGIECAVQSGDIRLSWRKGDNGWGFHVLTNEMQAMQLFFSVPIEEVPLKNRLAAAMLVGALIDALIVRTRSMLERVNEANAHLRKQMIGDE